MTGTTAAAMIDVRDAFFEGVRAEARLNGDLVVLLADMGAFSLDRFRQELPRQVINVGIAEQNLINVAAGLALAGKRVVVYSITAFVLQRCYEQIKVNVADPGLPVTVAGIGPGLTYSNDGHSHHAIQDVANVRALPRFTILSPADPVGFAAAAGLAARTTGPLYIRLDKGRHPNLPGLLASDGCRVLARGDDVLVLATGLIAQRLPALVDRLAERGIGAEAILVERLKPLDQPVLHEALGRHRAVVTLEEHLRDGGLGTAVAELIVDRDLDVGVLRLGLPESVVDLLHGDREWMLAQAGLAPAEVTERITAFLGASRRRGGPRS